MKHTRGGKAKATHREQRELAEGQMARGGPARPEPLGLHLELPRGVRYRVIGERDARVCEVDLPASDAHGLTRELLC
jgi:hypothetical protein